MGLTPLPQVTVRASLFKQKRKKLMSIACTFTQATGIVAIPAGFYLDLKEPCPVVHVYISEATAHISTMVNPINDGTTAFIGTGAAAATSDFVVTDASTLTFLPGSFTNNGIAWVTGYFSDP